MLRAVIDETRALRKDGRFLCLICNKVLKNKEKSRKHFRDIHWADAPTFLCPEENYTYTSRNAFGEHIRRNHPEWKGVALDTFIKK